MFFKKKPAATPTTPPTTSSGSGSNGESNNNNNNVSVPKKVVKKKLPTTATTTTTTTTPSTTTTAAAPVKKKKHPPTNANTIANAAAPSSSASSSTTTPVVKKAPVKKHPPKKHAATTATATNGSRSSSASSTGTRSGSGAVVPYKPAPRNSTASAAPPPPPVNGGHAPKVQRNQEHKIPKGIGVGPKPDEDPWARVDPNKWHLSKISFNGSATYKTVGKVEKITGQDIGKGIKHFKANPVKYTAMLYQTSKYEYECPDDRLEYQYIHREGTEKYEPQGVSNKKGWMTMLLQEYHALPRFKDNILPMKFRDKYTDNMTFEGRALHKDKKNPPIMPGRGMGICDKPNIKIIGDVDPSDIHQGQVGDCWLLSGISSLAEFDGAIKRLFRKTPNLEQMPFDDGRPNKYIITYWDLETWTEVDIEIDERLAVDAKGKLLGSRPSDDGELWACYLEKAFAIHAGGWDKIVGGQCLHAWSVLTGCEYQYQIVQNKETKKYTCSMRFNPNTGQWCKHSNSPHDCDPTFYDCAWPEAGGEGIVGELTQEELWYQMCAWDDHNYIVAASTTGVNSGEAGLVDDHAYSVIECHNDVAGTPVDLIKVRNPWGKGEIEDGEFDDDGPGWDKWPQVKAAINPVVADDGIFYVTPEEFFEMFGTIFVSASDMTEFLED